MIQFTRTCYFLMIVALGLSARLKEDTDKEDQKEENEDAYLKGYTNGNICCIPDQWEGVMYFGYGDVFLDSSGEPNTFFTFVNGTINISYDKTNKKIYMHIRGVQLTPLLPHPERVELTYLFDYVHRIQYEFDDQKCDKSSLDADMTAQCIPVDILSESAGTLGASTLIYTYFYTKQSDVPYTVSASVLFDGVSVFSVEGVSMNMVKRGISQENKDDVYAHTRELLQSICRVGKWGIIRTGYFGCYSGNKRSEYFYPPQVVQWVTTGEQACGPQFRHSLDGRNLEIPMGSTYSSNDGLKQRRL